MEIQKRTTGVCQHLREPLGRELSAPSIKTIEQGIELAMKGGSLPVGQLMKDEQTAEMVRTYTATELVKFIDLLGNTQGMTLEKVASMVGMMMEMPEIRNITVAELKLFLMRATQLRYADRNKIFGQFGWADLCSWIHKFFEERTEKFMAEREKLHTSNQSGVRDKPFPFANNEPIQINKIIQNDTNEQD